MPSSASAPNPDLHPFPTDALPIYRPRAAVPPPADRRPAAHASLGLRRREPRRRVGRREPLAARVGSVPLQLRGGQGRATRAEDRPRSEEHTSELQSLRHLVCRLLLPLPTPISILSLPTLFRSIGRVLQSLRRQIGGRPLTRLSVYADGSRVVAWDGASRWQPESGQFLFNFEADKVVRRAQKIGQDRKSTRLNSSHLGISYAVFCFRSQPRSPSFPYRRSSDLSAACCSPSAGRSAAGRSRVSRSTPTGAASSRGTARAAGSPSRVSSSSTSRRTRSCDARRRSAKIGRAHV